MPDGDLRSSEAASAAPSSFEGLYREHFELVLGHLRRMGVEEGSLEDAAQDVFVVVHKKVGAFEGRSRLSTWLFSIAHHVAARYRRTAFRTERRHRRLADEALGTRQSPATDEAVLRRQADDLLHAFLDTLPPEQRGAFVLGEIEQLPRRELGIALGVSPNTAYSRLRLARARFSEAFGDRELDHALLVRWRTPAPEPARREAVWAALLVRIPDLGGTAAAPLVVGASGLAAVKLWVVGGVAPLALGLGAERAMTDPPQRVAAGVAALRPLALPASVPAAIVPAAIVPSTPAFAAIPLEPSEAATPRAAPSPRAVPPRASASPPSADDLRAELATLTEARRALRDGEPEAALARLAAHAERFGEGAFAIDREVLRIDALCAAGREREAAAATRTFLRSHGRSAQAAHVRAGCGDVGGDVQ